MQVAIVIPTYNEKENITRLLDEIKHAVTGMEINLKFVIVDDNSPDGTAIVVNELAKREQNIYLLSRSGKLGLGSAYLHGFKWILNNNNTAQTDIVIQMDADLSHPPQLIEKMVKELSNGEADVVVGSRYSGEGSSLNWPLHRKLISKVANKLSTALLGVKVKDMTSGYRAFKLNVIRQLMSVNLSGGGYEYQIESLYAASKMGNRIKEIPFLFSNRIGGKSKLTIKDILAFMRLIVNLKVKPSQYPKGSDSVSENEKQKQTTHLCHENNN
ncbi:MAG: polyprenol monophosphomannose synthase [Nitrosopumilus sp.]|nr:polyprenol monophosphomannose synthase [Nitrosopumilus sp.]